MKARLATALLLAAVAGCRESSGPYDATLSASVAVSPAPGALNVGRADTIRVWFDMPVESASSATRLTLHVADSTGAAVPGTVRFANEYRQMMFVPDLLLLPATRYFAHMRDSVMMRESRRGWGLGGEMNGGLGHPMMFYGLPLGAQRTTDGMAWVFTTGI